MEVVVAMVVVVVAIVVVVGSLARRVTKTPQIGKLLKGKINRFASEGAKNKKGNGRKTSAIPTLPASGLGQSVTVRLSVRN